MKLLIVDCCISQRGKGSRTRQLLEAFQEAFCRTHPEAEVETVSPQTLLALGPFDPAALDERDALASVQAWDAPVFALARQFRTTAPALSARLYRAKQQLRKKLEELGYEEALSEDF